ncbi:MAG: ATP-grasp domain-containing protein [Acidimicrobiales bacterium]
MTPTTHRPTVVVPHGYRSIPVMELASAAGEVCDLVWLVRPSDPECAAMGRLLGRLGRVVDIEDMNAAELATAVAPFAPDGIVAFRDDDLVPMAELAARLGLRFHRLEVARRLADKMTQRQALDAGGLAVPRCREIPARRDRWALSTLVGELEFPAVVKPRCGSGSRHTFLVESSAEFLAILDTLANKPGGREDMVVEEYLPSAAGAELGTFADYVSVETLATTDGLQHVAVTGRLHQVAPFRETGFFIPSDLDPTSTAEVLATASDALHSLGVDFGCVHTEIKLTPEGPRVIEVNGRMGGGVAEMLQMAAGQDLLAMYLRSALGQPVEIDGLMTCDRIGYRLFYQPPISARRIRSVGGLQDIGALAGVDAVGLHLSAEDPVDPYEGTRSFVFSVVGSADTHAEVAATNARMYELADVVYEHETDSVAIGAAGLVSA